MADLSRRSRVGAILLVSVMAIGLGGGRAEAQFTYGFGLNGGTYLFYTPGFGPSRETQYLSDRSASLSAHYAALQREELRNHVGNPRDFKNYLRENPNRWRRNNRPRRSIESSTPPTASTLELASFLGSDGHVNWPRDIPGSPELDERRNAADEAIRAAAGQTKDGQVTAQDVNLAREKLIAFGQPSLAKVRAERATVVAESFHSYLRQLLRAVELVVPVKAKDTDAVATLPADG